MIRKGRSLSRRVIDDAIDQGFTGLRLFNSAYLPEALRDSDVHLNYSSSMGRIFSENKVVRISLYDLNQQEPEVIINAILSHPTIILRGIVCSNFFYVPTEQLLSPKGSSRNVPADGQSDHVHHNELRLKKSHDELESANVMLREEINKRKMVEWALLISELRYRNTLDSINEPVIVIDRNYKVIVTNKAMETMGEKFGVAALRWPAVPRGLPQSFEQELDVRQGIQDGETIVTRRVYDPNGVQVWAEVSKVPMMEGDRVANVTTIIRRLDKKE